MNDQVEKYRREFDEIVDALQGVEDAWRSLTEPARKARWKACVDNPTTQTNRDRQSWHCRSLESRLDQSLLKANSQLYTNTSTMLLIMLGYGRGVAQPARQG